MGKGALRAGAGKKSAKKEQAGGINGAQKSGKAYLSKSKPPFGPCGPHAALCARCAAFQGRNALAQFGGLLPRKAAKAGALHGDPLANLALDPGRNCGHKGAAAAIALGKPPRLAGAPCGKGPFAAPQLQGGAGGFCQLFPIQAGGGRDVRGTSQQLELFACFFFGGEKFCICLLGPFACFFWGEKFCCLLHYLFPLAFGSLRTPRAQAVAPPRPTARLSGGRMAVKNARLAIATWLCSPVKNARLAIATWLYKKSRPPWSTKKSRPPWSKKKSKPGCVWVLR